MVRCYDCAVRIPEGQISRMTVITGMSGRYVRSRKVNLCPECADKRTRTEQNWRIALVVCCALGLLVYLLLSL